VACRPICASPVKKGRLSQLPCLGCRPGIISLASGTLLTSRSDALLEAAFQVVGEVEQAIVLRERTNFKATGNGLGYVTFVREDDAPRAVEQLDGLLFQGRAISLEITSTPRQAKQIREISDEVQPATQPRPPLTHTLESSCKQQSAVLVQAKQTSSAFRTVQRQPVLDSPSDPLSRSDGGLFRNANGKMQTWSPEENDLLRRLAAEMTDNKGRPMWTTICQHLQDRTAQEVRGHTSTRTPPSLPPEPRPHRGPR